MTQRVSNLIKYIGLGLGITLLGGCASDRCCDVRNAYAQRDIATAQLPAQDAMPATPIKLQAVGHGTPGAYTQHTHAQQRLMAMRAAQVDAYRNLAEQVYGFRVWGGTSVSAFATQNDSIRTYVDAVIRGARLVNITSIADGNFEATVELEVSQQFHSCMTSPGSCDIRAFASGQTGPLTAMPNGNYVSN
ncbi:LPP20 family lipoprotein [Azonexus sp.]|uniref:LPP20 family lipoprotein n=1 Tax=Azonexus sp. TaxID=1872668 RepID=UPI0027BB0C87|nr:LPP20 family lipoprotein [Azonexus sp.]